MPSRFEAKTAEKKAPRAPKPQNKKISSSTSTPSRVTLSPAHTKSKGVTFNLRRNSFAEYNKENPPSVVKRLPHSPNEVRCIQSVIEDNETTRKNAEVLAEWDSTFVDFDEDE